MKKNATMGANNGQMMMNNGSVIMKKGATMDTNVMASGKRCWRKWQQSTVKNWR